MPDRTPTVAVMLTLHDATPGSITLAPHGSDATLTACLIGGEAVVTDGRRIPIRANTPRET